MPNRLHTEPSPYLRQHADNPVDWYPWGPEALARARAEDRPILLSVGYAACHWCHVMAHESFEDGEVAAVMNRLFVNIKVDREERPDLDHLYQHANQVLNGRPGGWPLTVFLAPDQTPFFSGTYFPKQSRHGLIGFVDLMQRIDAVWRTRRADLDKQNTSLRQHLAALTENSPEAAGADPAALTAAAIETLASQADRTNGGLVSAPKFPHPVEWRLLLLHGNGDARAAALHTLRAMAMGGLQDQVGGGFFRYCVDDGWQIPHFEKMLYDNALMLGLYAEAQRAAPDPLWVDAAEGIVDWLQREMLAEGPAFCASLDADSDHEEGAFYVWTPEEARAVIGDAAMRIARPTFGLDGPPNFEGNAWHLRRRQDDLALANALGLSAAEFAAERARLRGLLLAERETRVRPGLDDKQITAWNALMCTGLLRAGRLLDRPQWIALSRQALDALRRDAVVDGRLRSIRQHGTARLNAYLDDHAFLLEALVESLQADYRKSDLAFAEQIAAAIVEHFQDAAGVLWMTSDDHETLLSRPRNLHDNAIPSGAAVAVGALARLGTIAGNPRWNEAADRAFAAHLSEAAAYPAACASLWLGVGAVTGEEPLVSIRAPSATIAEWRRSMDSWLPAGTLVCCRIDEAASPQATLCHLRQCHPPVADLASLKALWASVREDG